MKCLVCVLSVFAILGANALDVRKLSPKYRAKIEQLGGFVESPQPGGKNITLLNAQKVVSGETVDAAVNELRRIMNLPLVRQDASPFSEPPWDRAKNLIGNSVGAVIFLVDVTGYPSLVVAPEQCWALINVSALKVDGAAWDVVADRVEKEINRAFAMLLGASNSLMQPCVMRSVHSLKDLDAVNQSNFCPEPLEKIRLGARSLDIRPFRRGTYRSACLAGWAPPPTNDIQRAIWNKTHELPTNPLPLVKPTK